MTRAKITIIQEAGDELVLSQDDHMGNNFLTANLCLSRIIWKFCFVTQPLGGPSSQNLWAIT